MLRETNLVQELQQVAWDQNNNPLCIYGDMAYPLNVHLQTPIANPRTQPERDFNSAMTKLRVSVEWVFGEIKNFYKFIDYKKQLKLGLSPIGKYFLVCGLLHNARTCLYGNIVSEYFDVKAPELEDYFQ